MDRLERVARVDNDVLTELVMRPRPWVGWAGTLPGWGPVFALVGPWWRPAFPRRIAP